ncbi:flavodoxin [Azomonas macrocytogenes]|uniref:Flavodoxin n=1 Tax=Azomonas macrocytogenes TaxID=69962 RepID=A0A839T7I3_AZOMA|nr:flavodoxin [Azomonas macrocytogenes]MBB3104214.1 flavodoxin I [Azomonas macrocytogenes]
MSVTIVYGSDGGCTRKIAKRIASQIDARLLDIKQARRADLQRCPLLILGCPAHDDGARQSDWKQCLEVLEDTELDGKTVALFGSCGRHNCSANFLDALGALYEIVAEKGASVVGFTDTEGYDFSEPTVVRNGRFADLASDEDNQFSATNARINAWLNQLIK